MCVLSSYLTCFLEVQSTRHLEVYKLLFMSLSPEFYANSVLLLYEYLKTTITSSFDEPPVLLSVSSFIKTIGVITFQNLKSECTLLRNLTTFYLFAFNIISKIFVLIHNFENNHFPSYIALLQQQTVLSLTLKSIKIPK